jgi:hypothetical protein
MINAHAYIYLKSHYRLDSKSMMIVAVVVLLLLLAQFGNLAAQLS